jgi:hypothetical protein
MANRFLDTNYYKSPFVRGLEGPLKSLYSFIICDCDGAGIWNMDLQAAAMYTGFQVTPREFEENFTAKGKAINLGGSKFFFPDFIEHQYPAGLQANNKAHKNFISTLKKFGLLDEDLKVKVEREGRGLEASLKASHVMYRSSNGNGQGIGNGKEVELQEIDESVKWKTRPGKEFLDLDLNETKAGAVKQLFKLTKNHNLTNDELKLLWGIFKAQNFNGEKFYATVNDVYSHFINWSKTQKIDDKSTSNSKQANGGNYKTAGQNVYAERLREQLSNFKSD